MAQPTLNDLLATILVLRTLTVVCALPPFLFFVSPFVMGLLLLFFNTITLGYGMLSIGATVCLVLAGRATIVTYAPSPKKAQEALTKSIVALPMVCYVAFQLLLHVILVPACRFGGLAWLHHASPTPNVFFNTNVLHWTLQMAGGMGLMGLSVVARYYGPTSIMRCSPFPLISRPIVAILRSLIARCLSGEGILILLAAPSDTPGGMLYSPSYQHPHHHHNNNRTKGRRYQGPEFQTTGLLLVFTHVLTYMSASVSMWTYAPTTTHMCIMTACITAFLHTMFTCIDGQSHELTPSDYRNNNTIHSFSTTTIPQLSKYLKSMLCSAAVVPTVYYLANVWGTTTEEAFDWTLMGMSFLASIVFTVYLSMIDFASRFFLCASRFHVKRLISEVVPDPSPNLMMEVIVQSLVLADATLFQSITKPSTTRMVDTNDLEEEELMRSKEDSDKLALLLMTFRKSVDPQDGLSCDMLRVVLLESFGGKNTTRSDNNNNNKPWIPLPRHEEVIKSFFVMSPPIVRALCAYAAGLGIALAGLESPTNKKPTLTPIGFETWALPPGALNCSEQAIVGATRCVIHSILYNNNNKSSSSYTTTTTTDWRSTQLSMFVPVVLVAAFQLRDGLLKFEKTNPNHNSNNGQCGLVQSTCDGCALSLLETMQSVAESRIVELTIQDKDCRAWLDQLVSQMMMMKNNQQSQQQQQQQNGTTKNPPVLILENDRPISQYNKGGFALKYY